MGMLALLETDVAYWIWYRYPLDYAMAQLADKVVGISIVGVVLVTIIRGPKHNAKEP